MVQLHGGEPGRDFAERLREAGFRVWRAMPFDPGEDGEAFIEAARGHTSYAEAILFDAKPPAGAKPGVTGGHGQTFDWDRLAGLAPRMRDFAWWVAGGLSPENVADLLRRVRPSGIDVSSGVEVGGGKTSAALRN